MSEEMLDYGEMKNNLLVYKSKEQVADICIAHYKEIERLNNKNKDLKYDLFYILEQLDGYLDKGWTIDLNFTDIREKYDKELDIED